MKIPYIKIPITDMYAYLAPCPAQAKGQILEAVLQFGMYQTWPALSLDPACEQAYGVVKQLIEREIKSYKKFCKTQKQRIKNYWEKMQNTDDTTVLPARNNLIKQKQEQKQEQENNISTVPPQVAQDTDNFSFQKSSLNGSCAKRAQDRHAERKPLSTGKTPLHAFARRVIKHFEPEMDNPQQDLWFKRNCRCLKEILSFCHEDIPLALLTIDCYLTQCDKPGFSCGYEGAMRNITNYYSQALKKPNNPFAQEAPYGN